MKVCLCSAWDDPRDGIAEYSRSFAGELERSFQVEVAGLKRYCGERAFYDGLAARANACDVCHIQFNYVHFNGDLPYRSYLLYFLRSLRIPSVVTFHELRPRLAPAGGEMPFLKRAVFNNSLFLLDLLGRRMHRRALGLAGAVIVHTEEHRKALEGLCGGAGKIHCIPHGIPRVAGLSGADRGLLKKNAGLEGKRVLTVFGFINARKGYECALDALALLPPDVVLLIAGGAMTENATDSGYLARLKRTIELKGLGERVRITGFLGEERIGEVMAMTDLCLAPFVSSAGSGSLSRCIGYGMPILASDIPEHREINARIPCLALFGRADAREFARTAAALLGDPALRSGFAAKTRDYASRYGFDNSARLAGEVYATVVERSRR